MARTKGSKNKAKTETLPIDPIQDNTSSVKKERGAALREWRERKKAEKLLAVESSVEETLISHEEPVKAHTETVDSLSAKENSPLTMIRKILRSNEPKKCYLVVEF